MVKKIVKKALKAGLTASAPLFHRKSTMTEETARQILADCSPCPKGTALAKKRVVEPTCDLQIVVPAYNVEEYLESCMDSILAQKTKYTYHVVLVEDGAKDRTAEIADKYADHPNVTVIHQENRGLSGARNTGMREIFGKYLLFVDSDDILCEGAIEALMDTAVRHDSDIVEGSAWYLMGESRTVMHRYEGETKIDNPYALHGHAWGKVFKAQMFENLCFPEGFWYEDSVMALLIFPSVSRVYGSPAMAYGYRINEAGIVKTSQGKSRAIETYYITERLMQERQQLGLPVDGAYFAQMLDQIQLNQNRIRLLPENVQESVFVLTCALFEKTFPREKHWGKETVLAKALRSRDFGAYKMCCRLY